MLFYQYLIVNGAVYDLLHQRIQLRFLPVICRGKIPYTVIPHHLSYFCLVTGIRIIHPDGMAALGIHQLHAGNVGIAVTNIDHVPERNSQILRRVIFIYIPVIHIKGAFFNTE